MKKGKVLLSSVNSNTPARTPYNVPISVDKSLKEFTVTASGHNTKINVLNPDGNQPDPKQIKPVLNLNNVKVINVQVSDFFFFNAAIHNHYMNFYFF